jgi:integrase
MWRWIQNQSRGRCEVLLLLFSGTNALILIVADRLDILTVSRRLGHRDASITLRVYGHLLDRAAEPDKLANVIR